MFCDISHINRGIIVENVKLVAAAYVVMYFSLGAMIMFHIALYCHLYHVYDPFNCDYVLIISP